MFGACFLTEDVGKKYAQDFRSRSWRDGPGEKGFSGHVLSSIPRAQIVGGENQLSQVLF